MLTDTFGRPINYLRISVTDRCNLRCAYCLPERGVHWLPREELLSRAEIVRVVKAGARLGLCKIRLTGGEPLIRPDIEALVGDIASIADIEDISLTTNGIHLEKLAKPLANAGLRRVNVSLDTLDADKFRRITRHGDFDRLWRGLLAADSAHLAPLKLNTVVVGGLNADELPALARLTLDHPWHVRFIELMPIGNAQDWGEGFPAPSERYVSVQEMHAALSTFNLQPATQPASNGPARTFRIPGAPGTVGFISPLGEHFCDSCNRLRLTADGRLRSCLLVEGEVNIRAALKQQDDALLESLLIQSVQAKPEGHRSVFNQPVRTSRRMAQVGG
jgi:cyclic pyranopterin phosphate synthase